MYLLCIYEAGLIRLAKPSNIFASHMLKMEAENEGFRNKLSVSLSHIDLYFNDVVESACLELCGCRKSSVKYAFLMTECDYHKDCGYFCFKFEPPMRQ